MKNMNGINLENGRFKSKNCVIGNNLLQEFVTHVVIHSPKLFLRSDSFSGLLSGDSMVDGSVERWKWASSSSMLKWQIIVQFIKLHFTAMYVNDLILSLFTKQHV